jgi:hypothetical protein
VPVIVQYVQGYGWHMGRLILWPLLFGTGVGLTFVIVLVSQLASAFFGWPAIVSFLPPFIVPLLFALALRSRLTRKVNGEPFVVNLPDAMRDGTSPWIVPTGHRHFRALVMVDVVMWGSSLLAQLGVAAAPIVSVYSR